METGAPRDGPRSAAGHQRSRSRAASTAAHGMAIRGSLMAMTASGPTERPTGSGQAPAHAGIPGEQGRRLAHDGLVADGAGRDETERNAGQLLEPLEIAPRLGRQLGLMADPLRRGAPARHLLVHRLGLLDRRLLFGEIGEDVAAPSIPGADLDGLALVEHV